MSKFAWLVIVVSLAAAPSGVAHAQSGLRGFYSRSYGSPTFSRTNGWTNPVYSNGFFRGGPPPLATRNGVSTLDYRFRDRYGFGLESAYGGSSYYRSSGNRSRVYPSRGRRVYRRR